MPQNGGHSEDGSQTSTENRRTAEHGETSGWTFRICPTVGLGMHSLARLIWQLKPCRVCSASQFPCWVAGKWLLTSNGVVKSLGLVFCCLCWFDVFVVVGWETEQWRNHLSIRERNLQVPHHRCPTVETGTSRAISLSRPTFTVDLVVHKNTEHTTQASRRTSYS